MDAGLKASLEMTEKEIEQRLPLIIVNESNEKHAQEVVKKLFEYGYFIQSSHAEYIPEPYDCNSFVVFMVKRG